MGIMAGVTFNKVESLQEEVIKLKIKLAQQDTTIEDLRSEHVQVEVCFEALQVFATQAADRFQQLHNQLQAVELVTAHQVARSDIRLLLTNMSQGS